MLHRHVFDPRHYKLFKYVNNLSLYSISLGSHTQGFQPQWWCSRISTPIPGFLGSLTMNDDILLSCYKRVTPLLLWCMSPNNYSNVCTYLCL
jgi:hypothetical protein